MAWNGISDTEGKQGMLSLFFLHSASREIPKSMTTIVESTNQEERVWPIFAAIAPSPTNKQMNLMQPSR